MADDVTIDNVASNVESSGTKVTISSESGNDERQPEIITVGATFTSFEEFKASLDHLKETVDSQTRKDYNKKTTN